MKKASEVTLPGKRFLLDFLLGYDDLHFSSLLLHRIIRGKVFGYFYH